MKVKISPGQHFFGGKIFNNIITFRSMEDLGEILNKPIEVCWHQTENEDGWLAKTEQIHEYSRVLIWDYPDLVDMLKEKNREWLLSTIEGAEFYLSPPRKFLKKALALLEG